jgi:phosphonate transport system substrate-binding protein
MIGAMVNKHIDLGYFGPLSYCMAGNRAEIEPFAAKKKKGSTTYHSVVIANTAAGINSLADISGKKVAYGDPAFTSSHLIPKSILMAAGLKPEESYTEEFVGAHDAVARLVSLGHAQAGGLSKPIFESPVAKGTIDGDKVKVLQVSKPFPQYPWAMQKDLDSALKEQIRQAFYQLDDKAVLKPLKAEGFAPITNADYDVVRDLARLLDLKL